jgi:hypothetical protein
LYRWRAEYGAVDRDAVKRLEADQLLDIQILKEIA